MMVPLIKTVKVKERSKMFFLEEGKCVYLRMRDFRGNTQIN